MADLNDLYQWGGQYFKPPAAVPGVYVVIPPRAPTPIDMPSVSIPFGQATMDIYYAPKVPGSIVLPTTGMNYSAGQVLAGNAPGLTFIGFDEEY